MDDRALLATLAAGHISGAALARAAGQTRAEIWKRIEQLRGVGVEIEGRAGKGYRLASALELLDIHRLRAMLAPEVTRQLQALEVAWMLDSTNTALLARPAPADGVAVLFAECQSAGRGRHGRRWASPLAAHLYVSLSCQFAGGLGQLRGLSVAVGVAVAEALRGCGFAEVGLKWPNDLMARGCKLGGVLIESSGEIGGIAHAVIGLGLNVRMPPAFAAGIGQPWIDLTTLAGTLVSRHAVAAAILTALVPALQRFQTQGLTPLLPRYAALDMLIGQHVRIDEAGTAYQGIVLGLADDGALRLRLDNGLRVFHAGDVSMRIS